VSIDHQVDTDDDPDAQENPSTAIKTCLLPDAGKKMFKAFIRRPLAVEVANCGHLFIEAAFPVWP
jgi:hypothetical protein